MHVNKRLGRFKQWAGERMGGEVKTNATDDFKTLEQDMNTRHEGMERMQKSMTVYIRALSKRNEGDDKEKPLAVGYLGGTMVHLGENFENDSEFGRCLVDFGRTNERIARIQEQYISSATTTWAESLERSLTQMKEYQAARKKLETRRLAYDTSLAKLQKAKREDFRVEEELRSQKVKYEESSDDVYRRMEDVRESEADSVTDLAAFLEAELSYHDRCREVLMQLKNNWPAAGNGQSPEDSSRRTGRTQSNTAHSYQGRYEPVQEEEQERAASSPERPAIRPTARAVSAYQAESPPRDARSPRPPYGRTPAFDSPSPARASNGREGSPPTKPGMSRVASDGASSLRDARSQLRVMPCSNNNNNNDWTTDDSMSYKGSPERGSVSPAASTGSVSSRATNSTTAAKKAPPPPPPSRSTKPPPPPPPVRRTTAAVDM